MAENTIPVPQFDLGIENSNVLGNLKEAEAFLSDTVLPTESADDLEKIIPPKKEEKEEKKEEKKEDKKEEKEEKKKSAADVVNDFFSDKKDDEEDLEDEKEPEEKEKDPKDPPEGSNQFESFSQELYKLNVLSPDEGEDPVFAQTGEDLLALLNKEKQKGGIQWVENFLEQHGEDRRELFDAIFIKGVDPKDYLPAYNEALALENLDLEQEKNQEKVVREFYRRAKVPEEKIDTKIQRLKDIAELQSEAEDFHPQLLEQDKQKAAAIAEAAEEQNRNRAAIEHTYKESLIEIIREKQKGKDIDGLPVSPKILQEAFDFLSTKKWKLADGSLLTDFDKLILETKKPENVEKRLKIALLEKAGWDFSKIQKKAISTESNKLFESLAHKDIKNKAKEKSKAPESSGW